MMLNKIIEAYFVFRNRDKSSSNMSKQINKSLKTVEVGIKKDELKPSFEDGEDALFDDFWLEEES